MVAANALCKESRLEMSKMMKSKRESKYCHATKDCITGAMNNTAFPFKTEDIDTTLLAFIEADLKTDNEEMNTHKEF